MNAVAHAAPPWQSTAMDSVKLVFRGGKPLVWLTWTQLQSGLVELRCVSLSREHAARALRTVNKVRQTGVAPGYSPIVRCWQEECQAEHLYGAGMLAESMKIAEEKKP